MPRRAVRRSRTSRPAAAHVRRPPSIATRAAPARPGGRKSRVALAADAIASRSSAVTFFNSRWIRATRATRSRSRFASARFAAFSICARAAVSSSGARAGVRGRARGRGGRALERPAATTAACPPSCRAAPGIRAGFSDRVSRPGRSSAGSAISVSLMPVIVAGEAASPASRSTSRARSINARRASSCAASAAGTSAPLPANCRRCTPRRASEAAISLVVFGAVAPVELVHDPGRHRGLLESLDGGAGLTGCLRQRVARRREISQRQLEELIDLVVERSHADRAPS